MNDYNCASAAHGRQLDSPRDTDGNSSIGVPWPTHHHVPVYSRRALALRGRDVSYRTVPMSGDNLSGVLHDPRTMRRSPLMRLLLLLLLLLLLALIWHSVAQQLCTSCYRLGNFLDTWYAREMALAVEENGTRALNLKEKAQASALGAMVRRLLRLEGAPWQQTFVEHAWRSRASSLPPTDAYGDAQPFLSDYMYELPSFRAGREPVAEYASTALRALVASYGRGCEGQSFEDDAHLVVHFRTGDMLNQFLAEGLSSTRLFEVLNATVQAAGDFDSPASVIELLDGGMSHRCDTSDLYPGDRDCGRPVLEELLRRLQTAYPQSQLVRRFGHSADLDFLRLACAPRVVFGAGSFALYGALAGVGLVRAPNCVLSHGNRLAQGSHCATYATAKHKLYAHPLCPPQCSLNTTNTTNP